VNYRSVRDDFEYCESHPERIALYKSEDGYPLCLECKEELQAEAVEEEAEKEEDKNITARCQFHHERVAIYITDTDSYCKECYEELFEMEAPEHNG